MHYLKKLPNRNYLFVGGGALLALLAIPAVGAIESDIAFVFNTLSFLLWGALVLWMCAGFTMLESGSVRTKNASVICLKNIGLFSIAAIAYYVLGYDFMYTDVDFMIGTPDFETFGYTPSSAEVAFLGGAAESEAEVVDNGYSVMSDWFFQMVFVATTASIVSGALAERVRLWSFFAFVFILTLIIYPVVGAMTWGGGFLAEKFGFIDFAGSTIVHSTGGWAALMGVILVGPRLGKFREDGTIHPTPPSNVPVVTLGVLILWLGWLGFNGGSVLALGGVDHAVVMSNVIANTCLAAAAGVITAMALSKLVFGGRMNLLAILNGAIAGLVSVTAAPNFAEHIWLALLIGAIGSLLCMLSIRAFEIMKIDDVVAAIPAHLVAGIWGTIAVVFTQDEATLGGQLMGILVVGVFVSLSSFIAWFAIDKLIGLRVSARVEALGQDTTELGIEAYPEFVLMPDSEMHLSEVEEAANE